MKDPNYYGRAFKRILVIADFEETNILKTFELTLVDEFKLRGIYAIANHKVLPPIREYSDEEKRNVYIQHNIDSYLIIAPQGFNTSQIIVPTISETRDSTTVYRNSVSGISRTITYKGGTKEVATSFNSRIRFYDITNGNAIWQGDANTILGEYTGINNIANSICLEIVEKLGIDGVIILNVK